MPVYEYQCSECGVRFERIQSFHDDPVEVCPECEGNVQRLIQPVGVIFKGSGFYVNDSKSSRKNLTAKKSETESKAASDSNGTSDSKKAKTQVPVTT
jgi:putative FmdB family regulatory protein